MCCTAPRAQHFDDRAPLTGKRSCAQQGEVALLGAETRAHPIGPDSRRTAEQQVRPDRWEVEAGGDSKRERAVNSRIQVDQVADTSGVDKLSLEDAAPSKCTNQLSDTRLHVGVGRNSLGERRDAAS